MRENEMLPVQLKMRGNMRTAIITDTNSGITVEEGRELGIHVMQMPVIINGEIYYEGVNLTQEDFYRRLEGGDDVSTSQPSPGDVMGLWDEVLAEGYDGIVYIPMSSGLSNSCHSAIGLAEEYGGRVQVADNHRISVTLRQAVLDANYLASQGLSAAEVREQLEKDGLDASIYIAVNTLEFLKKGGRVTPAGAAIGSILNIKPILTIQGEKLDAFAKVRGMKKCWERILQAVKTDREERFGAVPDEELRIGATGTFRQKEDADRWFELVKENFPSIEIFYDPLSFSIGCHVGPDATGIGICPKHRA